jgi:Rieske Fe-S protein
MSNASSASSPARLPVTGILAPDALAELERGLTRRGFLAAGAVAAIAATLGACSNGGGDGATAPGVRVPTGVTTTASQTIVDLNVQAALAATTGAYLIIENGARSLIVVNLGSNTFRALSAVCTHQGCLVGGIASNQVFCNCHGSRFSTTGAVVQGPAGSPLATFANSYDAVAKTITIAG